jgi:Glycosyl hydrolases family 16
MARPNTHRARWTAPLVGIAALLTFTSTVAAPVGAASPRPLPPPAYASKKLLFNETAAGSSISSSRWNTFITSGDSENLAWNSNGTGGSSPANASPDYDAEYDLPGQVAEAHGVIDIRATRTPTEGMLGGVSTIYPFASGVLCTYGKFEFTGGYVQIEAKVPGGAGLWPGFWMLPGSSADGPNDEIDIFEGGAEGVQPGTSSNDTYSWHLHTPAGTFGAVTNTKTDLTAGFNTYGLQWVPGKLLRWYLNGHVIGTLTNAQVIIPEEPMDLIMNLQVAQPAASGWHTTYNRTTPATSNMLISGVQVYS